MSVQFGKRLKELRVNKGLYQKDIAEELGVTNKAVAHWENNEAEPSIDMLYSIADFFNVTVDYLIGRENDYKSEFATDERIIKKA